MLNINTKALTLIDLLKYKNNKAADSVLFQSYLPQTLKAHFQRLANFNVASRLVNCCQINDGVVQVASSFLFLRFVNHLQVSRGAVNENI